MKATYLKKYILEFRALPFQRNVVEPLAISRFDTMLLLVYSGTTQSHNYVHTYMEYFCIQSLLLHLVFLELHDVFLELHLVSTTQSCLY